MFINCPVRPWTIYFMFDSRPGGVYAEFIHLGFCKLKDRISPRRRGARNYQTGGRLLAFLSQSSPHIASAGLIMKEPVFFPGSAPHGKPSAKAEGFLVSGDGESQSTDSA